MCIFCGGENLSKEHLWPEWAFDLLPKPEKSTEIYTVTLGKRGEPETKKKRDRQGPLSNKEIRTVCKKCNNGWMSELEESAKPILIPLILGSQKSLSKTDQKLVSEWVALKALISESDSIGHLITPSDQREKFKLNRDLPDGMRIWIGKCGAGSWKTGHVRESAAIYLPYEIPSEDGILNISTLTFGIGNLISFVFYSSYNLFKNMPIEFYNLIQIYPEKFDVILPFLRSVSELEAERFGELIHRIVNMPNVGDPIIRSEEKWFRL